MEWPEVWTRSCTSEQHLLFELWMFKCNSIPKHYWWGAGGVRFGTVCIGSFVHDWGCGGAHANDKLKNSVCESAKFIGSVDQEMICTE